MAKKNAKALTASELARHAQRETQIARRAQHKLEALARREHHKLGREKLTRLRATLREVIEAKKIRMKTLLDTLREQRVELRAELRATRKRILEELKDKHREERIAARVSYLKQKEEARRSSNSDVAKARAAYAAERERQAEQGRIDRTARTRHVEQVKAMAHREFDNVVHAKAILGGFGPIYERVKDTIRTQPGQTRAEAFLDHAQKNLGAFHAMVEPRAEAVIAKAKADIADVERSLVKPQPHELAHAARKVRERTATKPQAAARRVAVAPEKPKAIAAVGPKRKKGQLPKGVSMSLADLVRERAELKAEREQRRAAIAKKAALRAPPPANVNAVGVKPALHVVRTYGVQGKTPAGRRSWSQRSGESSPAWTGTHAEADTRAKKLSRGSKDGSVYEALLYPGAMERERLAEIAKRPEKSVKAPDVRDHAVLAKMIKADIHASMRAGLLPKATYSVRSDGNQIRVRASKLPFPVTNPDAYYVQPGANWVSFDSTRFSSRNTPKAQEVRKKLEAIVDAYHWDKSDLSTDYHHQRFYKDVEVEDDPGVYKAMEVAKVAAAKARGSERHDHAR